MLVQHNIEIIAEKNAKKVKLFNINDIESLDRNTINEADIYFVCKNGKITFVHSSSPGERIEMIKNRLSLSMSKDVNFCVKLNVHDSTTQEGILSFGKQNSDASVMFPDLYQLLNYYDKLEPAKKDTTSFHEKNNQIIFAGSSTGNVNIAENNRIKMCIWSLKNPWAVKHTYFKTTALVQINNKHLEEYLSIFSLKMNDIVTEMISQEKQLEHKYILSIDGNTYAWDRPIWTMCSNSVVLRYNDEKSRSGWYYELLVDQVHLVNVNEHSLENEWIFLENNRKHAEFIISNAKEFVNNYCTEEACNYYMERLFSNISYRY